MSAALNVALTVMLSIAVWHWSKCRYERYQWQERYWRALAQGRLIAAPGDPDVEGTL